MVAQITETAPLVATDAEPTLAQQLALINRKLDVIGEQVSHLHERTRALEELKDELVPIAKDAMGAVAAELQEMEHELSSDLVVELLRKLLRNTPTLIRMLDRLESVDDLVTELEPLGKDVLRDIIDRLQRLEEKGYFRLGRGLVGVLDGIVTQTSEEDVARLVDNVEGIAGTLKRLTKPSFGVKADAALAVLEGASQAPKPVGAWGMFRATRDPEVQQGLGMLLEMARALGRDERALLNQANNDSKKDKE